MADKADDDRLRLFENYDLDRYAFWADDNRDALKTDERGNIVWHHGLPKNADWENIGMVTINYDLDGEGHFRNIPISPDRPLDPYGSDHPSYRGKYRGGMYGPEYYYDLDDLATNFFWSTGTP